MAQVSTSQRLYSLDALRGFDMFWIMGGEDIFHTLSKSTGSPFWGAIANELTHPEWNGFHFYDLIFDNRNIIIVARIVIYAIK